MTRNEILRRYPNASESFIRANQTEDCRALPSAKLEHPILNGVQSQIQGTPKDSQRFSVRVISYRAILCDPDNLCGKYFVDCLRYAGLLSDDTAEIVDYSISQQKCPKAEEKTEIIIERIS